MVYVQSDTRTVNQNAFVWKGTLKGLSGEPRIRLGLEATLDFKAAAIWRALSRASTRSAELGNCSAISGVGYAAASTRSALDCSSRAPSLPPRCGKRGGDRRGPWKQ